MDKKEFRMLITDYLKGKNIVEEKTWLDTEFPDTSLGKSTIQDWYAMFRRGEMSTEDGERNGCPKKVVTNKNIKKIHKMILIHCKLKLHEIAYTLMISTERVHHMTHEYLSMRKLCVKWVRRELTFKQKIRRVEDLEQCLKMIKRHRPEFLRRYVTMDDTWLHYFTPNSNRQSSEWTAHDEPAPKCGKM
ncbi:histone-lysine N-methyltransferase SETMAR-like [Lepeophtheirus salmonis]|uniref:histone-lysine N-methyltransferase SETMAR-like n=1 Tax=Lepeophtheirus salmonis TaxID=72036 RepID=UPI001AE85934|nr:uncharacterized protein LOC121116230 [Lepeophtheirus salmonis]